MNARRLSCVGQINEDGGSEEQAGAYRNLVVAAITELLQSTAVLIDGHLAERVNLVELA